MAFRGARRRWSPSRLCSSPAPCFRLDGAEHLEQLAERLAQLSTELRHAAIVADGQLDPATTRFLIEACATVEHLLWQLESHLLTDRSDQRQSNYASARPASIIAG